MSNNTSLTLFSGDSVDSMLAKAAVIVKSGLAPKKITTPEAVIVACTVGAELGFSPLQSLRVINVIDGVPTLGINALLAIATQDGGEINVVEHSDTTCTLEFNRPGRSKPHTETFALADAQKANLLGKDNWMKNPKAMLYARCASNGIRRVWADRIAGLYSTEEMEDSTNAAPAPKPRAKVETKVIEAKPVTVVDAAPRAATVMDIPGLDDEPELPTPNEEIFAAGAADHAAALERAYRANFPAVEFTDAIRSRITEWATRNKIKVTEIDARMGEMKKARG